MYFLTHVNGSNLLNLWGREVSALFPEKAAAENEEMKSGPISLVDTIKQRYKLAFLSLKGQSVGDSYCPLADVLNLQLPNGFTLSTIESFTNQIPLNNSKSDFLLATYRDIDDKTLTGVFNLNHDSQSLQLKFNTSLNTGSATETTRCIYLPL